MRIKNPFLSLNKFEWGLFLTSVVVILASAFVSGKNSVLELASSLVGVTALIFVAKGLIIGQAMTVVFSFGIVEVLLLG